ncbi:MAG: hypothetical protein RIC55_14310 [Pirellulaceae bacterium]
MHRRLAFLFVLAAAAAAPQSLFAQQDFADTVYPLTGVPSKGTVTAMTRSSVTLDMGGTPREFPVNTIRRVQFATDPAELRRARDAVATGRFEDVKEDLSKVDMSAITQAVVKSDIEYYRALADAKLALAGTVDREAAHTALFDFLKGNGQNFHFFEAVEVLGDLAIARGKFAEAETYYGLMSQADWPDYKLRASILQAKAMIPQKKFAEAQKMYQSVIDDPISTPEVNREKQLAQVGKAVCLAETGDVQQAEKILSDIVRNNDPKDVVLFGRTYNALGAVHRKQGEAKKALLDYLHTDRLFYSEPDTHAEALYHLSKLWADAANNSDRALQARNLLKARYAGTLWSQLQ